jgi:phosphatidylglycerophosphate synthase
VPSLILSLKKTEFITDFRKGMRAGWSLSGRLDELLYFITWPLVFFLRRTKITPNQIALLSFLIGLGFITGIFLGWVREYPIIMSLLLLARVLLDCADGQLARVKGETSNLGALYDLASDFSFTILLFLSLAYVQVMHSGMEAALAISLSMAALFSFLCTTTIFSFMSFQSQSLEQSEESLRNRFIAPLPMDRNLISSYEKKLVFFNRVFYFTWRPISLLVLKLFLRKKINRKPSKVLQLFSFFEFSVQLIVLTVLILYRIDFFWYLVFELTGFVVMWVGSSLLLTQPPLDYPLNEP